MSAGAELAVLAAFAAGLVALAIGIVLRAKRNPELKERRRRLHVNVTGRLGDATITEVSEQFIFYSYSVGGVAYAASQDIANLATHLPAEHDRLIGHSFIKYTPRNPANSIVLCEEWSGLPMPAARTESDSQKSISPKIAV